MTKEDLLQEIMDRLDGSSVIETVEKTNVYGEDGSEVLILDTEGRNWSVKVEEF
jgi:hypothetical protein